MKRLQLSLQIIGALVLWAGVANATADTKDLLVKFTDAKAANRYALRAQTGGAKIENLGDGQWVRIQFPDKQIQDRSLRDLRSNPNVLATQPNYPVRLLNNYRVNDPAVRARLAELREAQAAAPKKPDNLDIPARGPGGSGTDGEYSKQWGMNDNNVKGSWGQGRGKGTIVAVIDTGVDYTHEDLTDNLWRNAGESGTDSQGRNKATNGVDDDNNGFIDDTIGWDFVSNDNKPYDLYMEGLDLLMGGGNPGHGTHCAGNVGAIADNGRGIAGVAPETKIMVLRFLSEKGEGSTAGAIQSINYAVKMGAKVLSNSWGSEGEDPADGAQNQALRDAIKAAQDAGVLFIAAAGNGHQGVGYDNDKDAKPAYPASYDHENIVSVAALDSSDKLGAFSNWGSKSVDIGAPGVVVFSTTAGGKYSDTVIDMYGIKATWDGTSMATPHVAGAAALYWSVNPNATWREVRDAIMKSSKPINSLNGKSVSGGKLNVENLMKY
jgi:subtilisin family serine protease